MKQSNLRERSRHEVEARSHAKTAAKSKIRTTAQKGIDPQQLQSVL